MRLFSWLVYASFVARLWLLAFGVPVDGWASVWIILLTAASICGDLYVWAKNRENFVQTMAHVIEKNVAEQAKRGQR